MVTRDAPGNGSPAEADPQRGARSGGRLRALDVVLLAIGIAVVMIVMPRGPFTTDEGEILLQQDTLDRTGGWAVPYPGRTVDPKGEWFPVADIERDDVRFLPHVKHPFWTTALRPLYRLIGSMAFPLVHGLALVAAAWSAAMLTRRLGAGRERAVFWAVGALSPVAVGTAIGLGHTVGAALVTAALAALAPMHRAPRPAALAAAAVVILAGVLVRNEVVLAGVATAAVALWCGRRTTAAILASAVGLAYVLNNTWLHAIWGESARSFTVVDRDQGWLAGRVDGALRSLVGTEPALVPVVLAGLGVVAVLILARSRPTGFAWWLAAGVAIGGPIALAVADPRPISGIVLVAPILVAGLVRLGGGASRPRAEVAVLAVGGLTVVAILATQYSDGGGLQWGGRFFHVVVPAALAVAVPVLADQRGRLMAVVGAAALVWTAVGVIAVADLRSFHGRILGDVAAATVDPASPDSLEGAPVIAGDLEVLGALSWDHLDEWRAFNVDDGDLDRFSGRLTGAGVDRWTLVWTRPHPPRRIGDYVAAASRKDVTGSLWLVTMERP